MPLEFDPLWKLSDPAWALALGLPVITIIAALVYFPIRRLAEPVRLRYTRRLALVAEVLVSVGIVGLITFAARAMIDSDIRKADAVTQELQRQVNVTVWEFAKQQCAPKYVAALASPPEVRTVAAACNWWLQLIGPVEFVDWPSAKEEFLEFSKVKDIRPELSGAYGRIAVRIEALIRAQNGLALYKHKKMLLETNVSWVLIAVSAVLSAIGVALKWARTALDLNGQ